MNQYKVIFEVYNANGMKSMKEVLVEAGNRKIAVLRAMGEINKLEGYSGLYKNVKRIEEVA